MLGRRRTVNIDPTTGFATVAGQAGPPSGFGSAPGSAPGQRGQAPEPPSTEVVDERGFSLPTPAYSPVPPGYGMPSRRRSGAASVSAFVILGVLGAAGWRVYGNVRVDGVQMPAATATLPVSPATVGGIHLFDCFDGDLAWGGPVTWVDCDGPYDWRVSDFTITAHLTYPGEWALLATIRANCRQENVFVYPAAEEYECGQIVLCLTPGAATAR